MNTRFLSVLFLLFLGLGIASCSKNESTGKAAGQTDGENFRKYALSAYDVAKGDTNPAKIIEAASLFTSYQKYKENSSDSEWKKGFLNGVTNFDETKNSALAAVLDSDKYGEAGSYVSLAVAVYEVLFGSSK